MTGTDVGLRIGDVYAQAFYDLAEQAKIVQDVRSDMDLLDTIMAQEKDFLNIMSSPSFSGDYKQQLINGMFMGRINELTLNFLFTANRHNRLMFLPEVVASFTEIWEAHHGFRIVELTVPETISDDLVRRSSEAIASAIGKKVILKMNVKPAIIGGAVIRFGDRVIDNSVRTRVHRAVSTVIGKCQGQG